MILKDKKLFPRIITALIAAPIIVYATYLGQVAFLLLVLILAILCLSEIFKMTYKKSKYSFYEITSYIITSVLILSAYFPNTNWVWNTPAVKILTIIFIIYFLGELLFEKIFVNGQMFLNNLRNTIYIGYFFSFFILMRNLPEHGLGYAIFLTFAIWSNDTFAYFIGLSFGKHKLNPKISPKKSIEGAIGGFAATLIFAYLFGPKLNLALSQSLFIGAAISLLAQSGDLLESLYKRTAQAKDSSNLLPGHGGFLDRMDSFILTGPLYYLLIVSFL
jgi:phosphatidate cytidylyltransferase